MCVLRVLCVSCLCVVCVCVLCVLCVCVFCVCCVYPMCVLVCLSCVLCVCCVYVPYVCVSMYVEAREPFVRISFLLSISGTQGLNLGLQTWQKAPFLLSHITHLRVNNLNNSWIIKWAEWVCLVSIAFKILLFVCYSFSVLYLYQSLLNNELA